MLYKLNLGQYATSALEPVQFYDLSAIGKLEKDLENILANHLLDMLFEDAPLMTIFQERQRQSEADLYALDQNGDLVIFELKRGTVIEDAVRQLLGYAQDAGQWTFKELQKRFAIYGGDLESVEEALATAHCEAFQLERAL